MPRTPEAEMIRAAKSGNVPLIQAILAQNAGLLNAQDTDGSTPLHCAAWKCQREAVAALLAAGADVHAQNQNGHWGGTPLHAAAHAGDRQVAEQLLDAGADPNAVSGNGRTPLEETTFHNQTAVAKLLRGRGALG